MFGWPRTSDGVVPRTVVLLGPVGQGKTTFAAALGPQMAPKELTYVAGHVPAVAERMGVPFHPVTPYDRREATEFFIKVERSDQHFLFVLDDCDTFTSAQSYGSQALLVLANTGRNFGKGCIFIGHGSNSIPKNLLTNAHLVCYWRTSVPGVLDYAKELMADWPLPAGADLKTRMADLERVLRNLPEYQCLLFTPLDPTTHYPGFAKVVNGRILVYPLEEATEEELPDDESPTDDASSADGSSPDASGSTAPDAGATPTGRPTDSPGPGPTAAPSAGPPTT